MSKNPDSISALAAQVSAPDGWLENSQQLGDLPYHKHEWFIEGERPTVTDAHGRVWDILYPGRYRSGSVSLQVDADHAPRVDIMIDGYWVAEQATVDQAQAWVAAPRSQTIMQRLWAWVAL